MRGLFSPVLRHTNDDSISLAALRRDRYVLSRNTFAMETANSPNISPLDFASSPINKTLSSEKKIEHYRQMTQIRRFEQAGLKQYSAGKMGGFLHL